MNIPEDFLDMVKKDIERIDNAIGNEQTTDDLVMLHREIDAHYHGCIANWHSGLSFWIPKDDVIYLFSAKDGNRNSIIENLKLFKAKLETYAFGMNAVTSMSAPQTNVNITTNVSTNISFEAARRQIEDMTSLTEEQTNELLHRLDEIEETLNSSATKKGKWEKLKPVLVWLGDKSFDVAKVILPLLLKINQ